MHDDDVTKQALQAAFHHAGHAVAAHVSKFHVLAQPVKLDSYGSGEVTAALSRRKLLAADKVAAVTARADPEVAAGIAVILCAGYASEELAAARAVPVRPDRARSTGDFAMARAELEQAGMAATTAPYEDAAAMLLAAHWDRVRAIAERLALVEEMAPDEIADLLEDA